MSIAVDAHTEDQTLITSSGEQSHVALPSQQRYAQVLLVLTAATYGTNYVCVKQLDDWAGSASTGAALRFLVSAATVIPIIVRLGYASPRYVRWEMAWDGAMVGAWSAAGYAVQAIALRTSKTGIQAFLLSLSAIVCPILEACIDRKQQPAKVWIAAALAVLGVAMLQLDGLRSVLQSSHTTHTHTGGMIHRWNSTSTRVERDSSVRVGLPPGDYIGLLQAFFFGIAFFVSSRVMERQTKGDAFQTALAITAWLEITVLVVSSGWVLANGTSGQVWSSLMTLASSPLEHAGQIALVLWTGVVTTVGCALAETFALGQMSSSAATVIFASEPLWAVLFGYVALGESFSGSVAAGAFLILAACLISGTGA